MKHHSIVHHDYPPLVNHFNSKDFPFGEEKPGKDIIARIEWEKKAIQILEESSLENKAKFIRQHEMTKGAYEHHMSGKVVTG